MVTAPYPRVCLRVQGGNLTQPHTTMITNTLLSTAHRFGGNLHDLYSLQLRCGPNLRCGPSVKDRSQREVQTDGERSADRRSQARPLHSVEDSLSSVQPKWEMDN